MADPMRAAVSSRRRSVRLEAPPGLTATLSDPAIAVTVVDVSVGGLGLLASRPLARNTTYTVTLKLHKHTATCRARATHARRTAAGLWAVGVAFVHDGGIAQVEQLLDSLTRQLIDFS